MRAPTNFLHCKRFGSHNFHSMPQWKRASLQRKQEHQSPTARWAGWKEEQKKTKFYLMLITHIGWHIQFITIIISHIDSQSVISIAFDPRWTLTVLSSHIIRRNWLICAAFRAELFVSLPLSLPRPQAHENLCRCAGGWCCSINLRR